MKKTISILLMALFPLFIFSQKKAGAFIGLNNSSISEGILGQIDISNKIGFHFGGFYELKLSNKIKFRPKLIYSQQGNRDNENYGIEHINYKTEYLNLPLNFKFYDKTYILAGPQIGFLLAETQSYFLDNGEKIDFGVNIGFGQKINDLFLELNFYQGITKAIYKPNYNGNLKKGTNTLIQFSIGYYVF